LINISLTYQVSQVYLEVAEAEDNLVQMAEEAIMKVLVLIQEVVEEAAALASVAAMEVLAEVDTV
jgi:hypothetical protein